ncbi:MAG: hypothetical protein ISS52_06235 [Dehalococcoidia bacterium]|nr:hypothetical protein [Dehalococcoidia bacterium]
MECSALIIGTHSQAENVDVFDWAQELPSMSDYDIIILDTTKIYDLWSPEGQMKRSDGRIHSLLEKNAIHERVEGRLHSVKEKLTEILEYRVAIYVLFIPDITMKIEFHYRGFEIAEARVPSRDSRHYNFSMEWCPISIDRIEERGKAVVPLDLTYDEYFRHFRHWEYYFDTDSLDISEFCKHYYTKGFAVTPQLTNIATNRIGKPIAIQFTPCFHRMLTDEEALGYREETRPFEGRPDHIGGNLVLLPVANKYDTRSSIEFLLRHEPQFEEIAPSRIRSEVTELGKTRKVIESQEVTTGPIENGKKPWYSRIPPWVPHFIQEWYKTTLEAWFRAHKS